MDLTALQLKPDLARIGEEIRVVGNDAGEKLSILSGVISRLDRNAPDYGEGYCDFNTNYIQAAAAATGGSSGSPVVNIDGHAIALQAGGRADGAATDYFLPLDRPLRALECIRQGKPVSRGTIQTQWTIKPFDECRRLGLEPHWEAEVRKTLPKETGMLVAETVLPEGPAHRNVVEGDVLVKVNGKLLTQFVRLDSILDSNVGATVKILVQRGGNNIEMELDVGDLHAITPDRYVTVAGGSFHNLSYQQARHYAIAVKGLYVCEASGSFKLGNTDCPSGWMIESVDKKPTPDLDTFVEVMKGIPDRERVVLKYKHLTDLHTLHHIIVHIDRHWMSTMRMAIRNDNTGIWDFVNLGDPLPAAPPVRRKAEFVELEMINHPAAASIIRSFVKVTCSLPLKLDGFPRSSKVGFGLVVDAEKGLVIVSRCFVPYELCDLSITIADSIIVEGKVLFLHPLEGFAIIQYDPSLVDAPVQSAKLSPEPMKQGDSTVFFGFNIALKPVVASTHVTDIAVVAIPAHAAIPRYRAINIDSITVDTGLAGQCATGVLMADDGTVQALWLSYLGDRSGNRDIEYHLGVGSQIFLPVVNQIQNGETPRLPILNVETQTMQMSQVRIMGVADHWIDEVAQANRSRHQLFMVRKIDCAPPTGRDSQSLKEGDIILTLNGKLITRVTELSVMYDNDFLDALVVRDGEELSLKVPTIPTEDLETDRAVIFCGAVLHRPHHAVRQLISKLHSEVYISARTFGSPASQYGLGSTNFITQVNDSPTPTLSEFLALVNTIPDNTYFRLKLMTFDDVPWVATLKKNEHYFPTIEFWKGKDGWEKKTFGSEGLAGDGDVGIQVDEGVEMES